MKRKFKVYRLEDTMARGPYVFSQISFSDIDQVVDKIIPRHGIKPQNPLPQNDGILNWSSDMFFGFKSIEDLKRWFTTEQLESYNRSDYHIRAYIVSERNIRFGGKQLIFRKFDAQKGKIIRISEIL